MAFFICVYIHFHFMSLSVYHSFLIESVCWQKFKKHYKFLPPRIEVDLVIKGDGHRGTTDEFATIPFRLVLFSAALVELTNSIPVHSLILSSHLFLCPPLLFPFTVPCRIVIAKPEDFETWPNHLNFRFLTGSGVYHIFQWLLGSFC